VCGGLALSVEDLRLLGGAQGGSWRVKWMCVGGCGSWVGNVLVVSC